MAIDHTIVQLIKDVKREGSVPSHQNLYTNEDFAAAFTECQKMRIVPDIMKTREEHFVVPKFYDWSDLSDYSSDHKALKLPDRTIGNRIRGVNIVDMNGRVIERLDRLAPEDNEGDNTTGYIFQGNTLLIPSHLEQANTQLRVKYFRRPNNIVEIDKAGKITAIDLGTGALTLDTVPADMAAGTKIDIISGREPFNSISDSEALVSVGGSSVQVSLVTAALCSVGDYVNFEYETVIPQLPVDVFPILTQFTVAKVLKTLGDNEGAAAIMADLPALEDNIYELLETRDEGSPQKIVAPNGLWTGDRRWRKFSNFR